MGAAQLDSDTAEQPSITAYLQLPQDCTTIFINDEEGLQAAGQVFLAALLVGA